MELAGLGAVVTGGGRGIGAAVARTLHARGARLLLAQRRVDEVAALATALGGAEGGVFAAAVDVSSEASVAALAVEAEARLGRVDVLVNNAGIATSAALRRQTLEEWDRVLRVNATGAFLCTRAFAPAMAERGFGRVINVASVMARTGAAYVAAYAASKHAVLGMTRALAAELAPRGVTVNAVCPGYVDTDMAESALAGAIARGRTREEALAAVLASVGQRRLVTPEEVAHLVAFLASPLAGAISGQGIVIDAGGLYA